MACAVLGLIVLTATLLGQQKLTVNSQGPMLSKTAVAASCASEASGAGVDAAPTNANATLSLKDADGVQVYSRSVSVQRFRYYMNDERESKSYQGGAYLATTAVLTFRYPETSVTKRAVQVELKMTDGTFKQVANLQAPKSEPSAKSKRTILIGQK